MKTHTARTLRMGTQLWLGRFVPPAQ